MRLVTLLFGALFGALAMFLLDPEQGRRRRVLVRDKTLKYTRRGTRRIAAKSRDLRNRAKGLVHDVLPQSHTT